MTSSFLQLRESRVATLGLSLPQANASDDFDGRGSGGYAITCILPGMRTDSSGQDHFSRIISYTVRERD